MRKSPLSILLAGIVTLFGVTHTFGQTLCKPVLTFKEVPIFRNARTDPAAGLGSTPGG